VNSLDLLNMDRDPDRRSGSDVFPTAMTEAEHQVMDLLAQAWNIFNQKVHGDPKAIDEDQREFMYHIHGAQNMILANTAGRVYPELYRLRGGSDGPE
jgi:hypothetical protein